MTAPAADHAADHAATDALEAAASLFRGFGEPSRLTILQHLALGEHRVVDLTEHLGLAQSTVSKHLACLRDCGLVTSRPDGRSSVFRLAHPDALAEVLSAAEHLLALTGRAVTLCPTSGHAREIEGSGTRVP
ncbi:winged helix-turn-helix transcriptional regulator [Cellulomonas sp. Sa3CUA2]|uniref:Winged helix-turn-helix transcriptional regulator n=1 Tax=Cellulomonas avistercoris TaxID=2762242 RepID=A0ABR8QAP3_9CELL|nr:metalloregulator ArsR/SmtB family transcription factor [Cellulomonas avistercoris]MBD7917497.1 winged helix-turn-helix transcriptional regulator [Cellulomonas avistercoris]